MQKNKRTKWLIISASLVAFVAICLSAYFLAFSPIYASIDSIDYYYTEIGAQYDFDVLQGNFEYALSGAVKEQQLLTHYRELPSQNPNDYITVSYNIFVTNTTIFDVPKVDIEVVGVEDDDFFLFVYSAPVPYDTDRLTFKSDTPLWEYKVAAYVGSLSEQEIEQKLSDISFRLSYKGKLGNNNEITLAPTEKSVIAKVSGYRTEDQE